MTAFSMVLLEQGVEADLPISLSDMLGLLDRVVPGFQHDGHGYQLASVSRAKLGSRWDLAVKLVNQGTHQVYEEPVGCVEVEKTGNDSVSFRVPPRGGAGLPGYEQVRLGRGLFRLLYLPDAQYPARPGVDATAGPPAYLLAGRLPGRGLRGNPGGAISGRRAGRPPRRPGANMVNRPAANGKADTEGKVTP